MAPRLLLAGGKAGGGGGGRAAPTGMVLSCHPRQTDVGLVRVLRPGKVLVDFFPSKYIFYLKRDIEGESEQLTSQALKLGRKKCKVSLVPVSVFFASVEICAVGRIS